jgi:hypothetical protein
MSRRRLDALRSRFDRLVRRSPPRSVRIAWDGLDGTEEGWNRFLASLPYGPPDDAPWVDPLEAALERDRLKPGPKAVYVPPADAQPLARPTNPNGRR